MSKKDFFLFSEANIYVDFDFSQKMRDVGLTHLAGTWIDRFRSALSSTSERISFDQIQLCTFTGHSSTVRKIITLDNENSFVSASQDKSVKLWSIKTIEEVEFFR